MFHALLRPQKKQKLLKHEEFRDESIKRELLFFIEYPSSAEA